MAGITARIRVLAAADSKLWTTVERVRDELGLSASTGSPEDVALDVQLQRRIERASRRLLKFTNLREVAFQKYAETIPGQADTILLTSRTPIVAFTKIEVVNDDLELDLSAGDDITPDIKIEDCAAGMLYRRSGWTWTPLAGSFLEIALTEFGDQFPGMEDANYRVTYEAGWRMPAQTTPIPTVGPLPSNQVGCPFAAFPADLEEAAVKQVVYDHVRRGGEADSGVASRHVADTTISYHNPLTSSGSGREITFGLAPDAFYLANPWRRIA